MNDLKISDHLQRSYDDFYEEGESEWRWLGAIDKADNIRTLCNGLPIDSIIEIGAGEGSILKRLSDLHFAQAFYALEISPTGVETIKKRGITQLRECRLFDGYNIPYDNQRFDLAVLSHVVEHVEYPRKLLYEASRVAKYVFVEVPLEDTLRLPRNFVWDKVGHINVYSPKTIRRLLQTCNLEVINQKTVNPSKDIYTYLNTNNSAAVIYYLKEYLLKFFPLAATEIFSYYCAMICTNEK